MGQDIADIQRLGARCDQIQIDQASPIALKQDLLVVKVPMTGDPFPCRGILLEDGDHLFGQLGGRRPWCGR